MIIFVLPLFGVDFAAGTSLLSWRSQFQISQEPIKQKIILL